MFACRTAFYPTMKVAPLRLQGMHTASKHRVCMFCVHVIHSTSYVAYSSSNSVMGVKRACKILCMRSRTGPRFKVSIRRTTGGVMESAQFSTPRRNLSVLGLEPETLCVSPNALPLGYPARRSKKMRLDACI